jgi:hypothetical protein
MRNSACAANAEWNAGAAQLECQPELEFWIKKHGQRVVVGKIKQFGTVLSLLQSGRALLDADREHALQQWLGVPEMAVKHWEQQQLWEMVDAINAYIKGMQSLCIGSVLLTWPGVQLMC